MTASSTSQPHNDASTANLSTWGAPYDSQGWIPQLDTEHSAEHWFQITYFGMFKVGAIVTQGCGNDDFWVYNYTVKYSRTPVEELVPFEIKPAETKVISNHKTTIFSFTYKKKYIPSKYNMLQALEMLQSVRFQAGRVVNAHFTGRSSKLRT